jgi:ssRNA-specific RNase YbeY (16S rRNA maturation enzyme)
MAVLIEELHTPSVTSRCYAMDGSTDVISMVMNTVTSRCYAMDGSTDVISMVMNTEENQPMTRNG